MNIHRSRSARTVALLASASLLLAACGGGEEGGGSGGGGGEGNATGVTESTIKVGTHMPLTGPVAPGYSEIPTGAKAYLDFVNAEGGFNGRTIEYVVEDDTYNPSKTSEVVDKLVLQDEVFAVLGGLGTPTHGAVLQTLNDQEVPDLFVSSGALAWDQPEQYPWTFGYQPDYEVDGKILGQYIQENFPDAKIGLYLQGDDLGRDGAKGIKGIVEDQVVKEVTYVAGQALGNQVKELQDAGADLVVGFNVPAYSAGLLGGARDLGWKPTVMFSSVGADAQLVGTIIATRSKGAVDAATASRIMDGTYSTSYFPTVDTPDNPWVQKFGEIWDEHGTDGELTNFRIYGMMQAYLFVSALQAAGEDLTRESLVEAIRSDGSSWKGPWLAPLDYSEETHRGISGAKVVKVENGKAVDQTPVFTTDEGDAPIEEVEEEPGEPTESGLPDVG